MIRASILVLSTVMMFVGHAAAESTYVQQSEATLRALDKITGRSTNIKIKVGEPIVFGSLKVDLEVCYQRPPEEPPESAAFLHIESTQPVAVETMEAVVATEDVVMTSEENPTLFSGWMFASSPGLSALEHPVYDIWVIRCTTPEAVKSNPDTDEQ